MKKILSLLPQWIKSLVHFPSLRRHLYQQWENTFLNASQPFEPSSYNIVTMCRVYFLAKWVAVMRLLVKNMFLFYHINIRHIFKSRMKSLLFFIYCLLFLESFKRFDSQLSCVIFLPCRIISWFVKNTCLCVLYSCSILYCL